MTKHSRAKEHQEIALAIKGAKKRMFELSRSGVALDKASDVFIADLRTRLSRVLKPGESRSTAAGFEALESVVRNGSQVDADSNNAKVELPPEALDNETSTGSEREDYELQEERIHVYTEDAIFVDGTSTTYRQQRALVKLLDTLANTPKDDVLNLLISARDFAIKNSPELTEEIAAKVCGREIKETPAVSAVKPTQRRTFDPDLASEERPYDVTPETIAEFMAANPEWEKRLLSARAGYGIALEQFDPQEAAQLIRSELGGDKAATFDAFYKLLVYARVCDKDPSAAAKLNNLLSYLLPLTTAGDAATDALTASVKVNAKGGEV